MPRKSISLIDCQSAIAIHRRTKHAIAIAALIASASISHSAELSALESSYRFLVGEHAQAGILYTAGAGALNGRQLPLSFRDSADYWGEFVCRASKTVCAVTDIYNPQTYTLTPQKNAAGDLQTERVNIHNGINIYDAATWQIAVMLGSAVNRFQLTASQDAYRLASNQNQLLREGYSGDASHAAAGQNRATTAGRVFIYNQHSVTDHKRAYAFRTLARNWLSADPFNGTRYAEWLSATALPAANPQYQTGAVTWTDWKPISGENAWAFLIGPLQAAYIHYVLDKKQNFVPFQDLAVQNAVDVLPTFAAMQAPIGAIYYAPAGTVKNLGEELIDPHEVAVENSFSLYAGLKILRATLQAQLAHQQLSVDDRTTIQRALQLCATMIDGGAFNDSQADKQQRTAGLLAFFKNSAWRGGEFIQGGIADDPAEKSAWRPFLETKAIDVNTWGIAALGAAQIDAWFGGGAAYRNWQQIKRWGAYGTGKTLSGVGFSDRDGNGIDSAGNYRQGILSTEWSAGAIVMLRDMISHYRANRQSAYADALSADEQAILAALEKMRIDNYTKSDFPGQPANYAALLSVADFESNKALPYLYASKRYLIPFGWYANPLPSTCATAWMIMLANHYNPFLYGGQQQSIQQ